MEKQKKNNLKCTSIYPVCLFHVTGHFYCKYVVARVTSGGQLAASHTRYVHGTLVAQLVGRCFGLVLVFDPRLEPYDRQLVEYLTRERLLDELCLSTPASSLHKQSANVYSIFLLLKKVFIFHNL